MMVSGKQVFFLLITVLFIYLICFDAQCADWPMWRYDAGRSAASPDVLPDELHLLWVRQYPARTQVWDDPLNQDLMPYDRIFEPVVIGNTMFLGFNDSDNVVALDTATGEEKWTFYTDGPVRFAPAAWNGRVYFTSDDGYLYCVDARSGSLVWKFRGGPSDRKILGNKRLISMWPARGDVVIQDGIVYFAAGIWPFMGIFIYALDAVTGKVVWINDSNGSTYMLQPHDTPSFAGVAPQGAFVISGDKLLVPGGRSVPACFDRRTGKFLYYELAGSGKTGGSFVCARGDVFFNHYREKVTTMYHLRTGATLVPQIGKYPVLTDKEWYLSGDSITAFNGGWFQDFLRKQSAIDSMKANELVKHASQKCRENKLWELKVDASGDLIKAGSRLYAAGKSSITAIDINGIIHAAGNGNVASVNSGTGTILPAVAWIKTVEGTVERLIAADKKLFAVTLDGRIMAFGGEKTRLRQIPARHAVSEQSTEINREARLILERTEVTEGYALFYGVGDGDLLEAMVNNSKLHVIAVDPDESRVRKLKQRFDANGLYGSRIAVHRGDPFTFLAPQYVASLTVVHDAGLIGKKLDTAFLEKIVYSMRPYGGVVWLPVKKEDRNRIAQLVEKCSLSGIKTVFGDDFMLLVRDGPLPGAGIWTHNYGNIANTAKSDDELVKLPLGILWFGGNSNMDVLPRHGHGPTEQVVGGRLFIEGIDCLSARDVYTGRVLWKVILHDLDNYGVYYDQTYKNAPTDTRYNQVHIPGANIRGTNFIATLDRIYIIQGSGCLVLDPATGETLDVFTLPPVDPKARNPQSPPWGYIGVYDDQLIAGYGFVAFSDVISNSKADYSALKDFDRSASKGLVVMNRKTGDVLWKIDAVTGFIHNGIAVGNNRIFCLDRLPPYIEDRLLRRGKSLTELCRLMSLDIRTGQILWEKRESVFGSFLSYSEAHDILLHSTRPSRDMVSGETGERIITYRGKDGTMLWDKPLKYPTFPILHGEKIVTEGGVFSLLTGEPINRINPMTGKEIPWTWKRNYGCNYPIASEHLLTFRSGAAGFFDLANLSGTGNFGGFKSGCTISLVAADGVLNAPDYTRTCNCAYQNQTSLAMVYMPDADIETWTFNPYAWDGTPVRRAGINFGAPGDRLADNGTLWLDYPSVGGESPDLPISISPEEPEWFRFHSSRITGKDHKWVAASGAKGLNSIRITMTKEPVESRPYTVSLYFTEPESTQPGERIFDVTIQGKNELKQFDIVKETGKPVTLLVKTFGNVMIGNELVIEFSTGNSSNKPPVISGMEIVEENQ